MTTREEIVQMGIAANLAVGVMNETLCAGTALTRAMETNGEFDPEAIPAELRDVLSHVLGHLSTIRELASVMDEFYDKSISTYNAVHPGQLGGISKEISKVPVIRKLQDIVGMSDDQRAAVARKNAEAIRHSEAAQEN